MRVSIGIACTLACVVLAAGCGGRQLGGPRGGAGQPATPTTDGDRAAPGVGSRSATVRQRQSARAPARPSGGVRTMVARVSDGDTIVSVSGRKIRLVQVDTPEVYGAPECYGRQASALTRRLLPAGKPITLYADPLLDDHDSYGRLLRYVFVGSTNVNRLLVRRGAASVWFFDGARGRYARQLLADVRFARTRGLGLWSACRGTRLDVTEGVNTGRASSHRSSVPARPPGSGGRFRWPSRDVDCAQIGYDYAHWLLARDRSDPFRLDGDGDGEACE